MVTDQPKIIAMLEETFQNRALLFIEDLRNIPNNYLT